MEVVLTSTEEELGSGGQVRREGGRECYRYRWKGGVQWTRLRWRTICEPGLRITSSGSPTHDGGQLAGCGTLDHRLEPLAEALNSAEQGFKR